MPAAGDTISTRLVVTRRNDGETWLRTFGDQHLVTEQSGDDKGLLVERYGSFEFRFRLHVREGGLDYQPAGVLLRRGRLQISLLRQLAPRIIAREEARGADGVHVSVRVLLPWGSLLISYEGTIAVERKPDDDGFVAAGDPGCDRGI